MKVETRTTLPAIFCQAKVKQRQTEKPTMVVTVNISIATQLPTHPQLQLDGRGQPELSLNILSQIVEKQIDWNANHINNNFEIIKRKQKQAYQN